MITCDVICRKYQPICEQWIKIPVDKVLVSDLLLVLGVNCIVVL